MNNKIKIIICSIIALIGLMAPMMVIGDVKAAPMSGFTNPTSCAGANGWWLPASYSSGNQGWYCDSTLDTAPKCSHFNGTWITNMYGGGYCTNPDSHRGNTESNCNEIRGKFEYQVGVGWVCITGTGTGGTGGNSGSSTGSNEENYRLPCPKTYFSWGNGCVSIVQAIVVIYNWLSIGVLVAVVIGIIIGGIQYSSAQGSQEQAKNGMKKIGSAVLALGLYFIMWALINFLVPGGILQGIYDPNPGQPYKVNLKDSHYVGKV